MKTSDIEKLHATLDIHELRNETGHRASALFPLLLFLPLLFSGCSSIPGEEGTNDVQINSGYTSSSEDLNQNDTDSYWAEKSVVLLQLDTSWNGKPVDALKFFPGNFQFALANLGTGTRVKPSNAVIPDLPDQNGRWMYFELKPGNYYLCGLPINLSLQDWTNPKLVPGLFLNVPRGNHVFYAGTIKLQVRGHRFLEDKYFNGITVSIADEHDAAVSVARKILGGHGSVKTALLSPCEELHLPCPTNQLFPALLISTTTTNLIIPDLKERARERVGSPMARSPIDDNTPVGSGGDPMGVLAAAAAYSVYSLVFAIPYGEISGSEAIKKYQPHLNDLAKKISESHPEHELNRQLENALGQRVVVQIVSTNKNRDLLTSATNRGCRSILTGSIQRIELREVRHRKYCVEVLIHLQFTDNRAGQPIYERTFLYTGKNILLTPEDLPPQSDWLWRLPFPPPYQKQLAAESPARALDAYCAPDGEKLMENEISHAIELSIKAAIDELQLVSD